MKQKLINFIREKLPFLFVFCIKRRWIYPEPLVYSGSIALSIGTRGAVPGAEREIFEVMQHQITQTAFEVYKKINYFPHAETLNFQKHEDYIGFIIVFRWSITAFYCPTPNYIRVSSFFDRLKNINVIWTH